ncbi:hypothetical protein C6B38_07150 [Spiroplasma sp. ChiS]|uniref:hypothetical protein n=1 Tax=Spiroplasma sp. ChiS TaxID=2099885 RepID=UPI000CF86021|nr:hypothetical protein [Spiroplasma sp. ChiS]PQP78274.1 hypothetical protein C6B38_07150 [Spiroplasma sp. ChiS]
MALLDLLLPMLMTLTLASTAESKTVTSVPVSTELVTKDSSNINMQGQEGIESQSNKNGKLQNFLQHGGYVINLNDVFLVESVKNETLLYFINGVIEKTPSLHKSGMWDAIVDQVSDR